MGSNHRVHNDSASAVAGHSVQAGQIHGDVRLYQSLGDQVVPRQLPVAARHFVDRAVEQDALTMLLSGANTEGFVLISTLDGVAGVGKSTLAVYWAHRVRDRFPDGELYVNLRGFDPVAEPMKPTEALASFLTALGVSGERMPQHVEDRAAMFRSLVHDKRMLILLDNALTADQVRPLLPSSPSCLVLVTSRNRLHELVVREGASRITLEVLTDDEAEELLVRYLGADRVATEPEAVRSLVSHCAGLPLALGIAAVRAAENPDFPLDELVLELQDERDRLDALDAGGVTGVRAVFSWSYRSLTPEAARMFRLLGLPTGPDISLAAVADLAGLPPREARALLAELSRANLIDQHKPGRYQFHNLIRAYAAECAAKDEQPEDRRAAIRRLLDHYLRTCDTIDRVLLGRWRFAPELPDSTVSGLSFETESAMLSWWEAEYANLVAAVRNAANVGLPVHAWQLTYKLMYLFKLRGQTDDWIASYEFALGVARGLGDRVAEAQLRYYLGMPYFGLKQYEIALHYQESALELFEAAGDRYSTGLALTVLAEIYIELGKLDDAQQCLLRGLAVQREEANRYGQGYANHILGILHIRRGELEKALAHLSTALVLFREDGWKFDEAFVLHQLAGVHLRTDHSTEALNLYRRAVELRREIGHRPGEAHSLRGLGAALHAAGDLDGSRTCWQQALVIFEELGDPEADEVRQELERS
ncbi:tetratricopeptide repeat protein [Saccharopolyspora sp. K220]|uniref:ATP-binding protein n=1 Tax=Saccharopolyspora soli TaxID=2926618 RepID=UPI001F57A790|nr:tetratricopeptide repeat protein [Saccharopolyspora soli]MCI2418684.1 tetratricopeptide repeat protein [Saccharopolyspora soli]